jgi:hypothetical protein
MTKRSTCRTMALPSPKSTAPSLQACSTSTPSATKRTLASLRMARWLHVPPSIPGVHPRPSASSNKASPKTIFGAVPSTCRSIRTHSPSSGICFVPKCDEKSAFEDYHLQEQTCLQQSPVLVIYNRSSSLKLTPLEGLIAPETDRLTP